MYTRVRICHESEVNGMCQSSEGTIRMKHLMCEHQLQTQSLYDDLTANVSGAEYSNDSSVTMTQQRERERDGESGRETDRQRQRGTAVSDTTIDILKLGGKVACRCGDPTERNIAFFTRATLC